MSALPQSSILAILGIFAKVINRLKTNGHSPGGARRIHSVAGRRQISPSPESSPLEGEEREEGASPIDGKEPDERAPVVEVGAIATRSLP